MLAHTGHHAFTFAATAGLDAAQTHTLCWHTLDITPLPLQPLLGWMLLKNTHAMLAHTGHHVFTLVRAAAAAVLEAVQMHTLCWHTLYISSLPWYGPQPLLGLMLHKHAHYAGTHSFLLFFCPIICANLRGTALVPPIPASPPPATPKTHSASRPITRCPLEETSDHWWAAI